MRPVDLLIARVDRTTFTASVAGATVGRVRVAVGDGVWELYSTVVEAAFEGRGIASRLVRHVLDRAEAEGVRVVPSCWYVDGLMQRSSPRYDHLRVGAAAVAGAGDACLIRPVVVTPDVAPADGASSEA